MGKSKPKRYRCLIWLQSPARKGRTSKSIAKQINLAFAHAGIRVHQHLDARFGVDSGHFYSQVIAEGFGINAGRLQELLEHLGQPLVLLQGIKATNPGETAEAKETPPVVRLDEKALKQQ